MVSHPELGSDPPIGLDRELGHDRTDVVKHYNTVGVHRSFPQGVVS